MSATKRHTDDSSTESGTEYFDEEAPLDQELVDAEVVDPADEVDPAITTVEQGYESAKDAAVDGVAWSFEFSIDDPELIEKADTAEHTTDRNYDDNKLDSVRGVAAEVAVRNYLEGAGLTIEDTEHFEKKSGDLVANEEVSIEVKARDLDKAYDAGFDAFPIRHSGFEADVGVLCLVSEELVVVVGWEHGDELAAWTRAYSSSEQFCTDSTETHDSWVYPYARTHSVNSLVTKIWMELK